MLAEREGFEPDSDPKSDQQVTDSEIDLIPRDPQETPWLSLEIPLSDRFRLSEVRDFNIIV